MVNKASLARLLGNKCTELPLQRKRTYTNDGTALQSVTT